MGFRYWLADLIIGGELTRLGMALDRERVYAAAGWSGSSKWARRCDIYMIALRRIAAEIKPTSNATVKRMGRIAEEALK